MLLYKNVLSVGFRYSILYDIFKLISSFRSLAHLTIVPHYVLYLFKKNVLMNSSRSKLFLHIFESLYEPL